MKIIITTSDKYHHILPVFFYLYGKYWNTPFELVGYAKPDCELPANCTWVSLGVQGDKSEWSTDLRRYFEQQPEWFVWMMEDTFIKGPLNKENYTYQLQDTGRFDLVCDLMNREYTTNGVNCFANQNSRYRLSTQPSIWNKHFLLQYLKPGLSPWDFETQDPKNDDWNIVSMRYKLLNHNEGVRRFDIYKLNLDGMAQDDIDHINKIAPWQTK